MPKTAPLILCFALLLASCRGGDRSGEASVSREARSLDATCISQGPNLRIAAKNNRFDTECLAAPSNAEVKIELVNEDSSPHNLSIYTGRSGAAIFSGSHVPGTQTETYTVGAQAPRRAYFVCDIRPEMEGVFVFE
jgi:hypothetical protein